MRILKKALPLWGAFFLVFSQVIFAACPQNLSSEIVEIAKVYDGDTVKLKDGRRIRLIGLNAPETKKEGSPAEPYANASRDRLRQLLKNSEVRLVLGKQKQDKYKRWLGHLYADGVLVSESLLRDGLAFHIAVPPNLKFNRCLKKAELSASGSGLWKQQAWRDVLSLKNKESGFRLLRGKVTSVKKIRSGWIIEVDDLLALKLSKATAKDFGESRVINLKGKAIQLRGWIRPKAANAPVHYQPWFLAVTHKTHIELI